MHRRSPHPLVLQAAAAALGCLLVLSCGSTNQPTQTSVVATFTPDQPTPADGSVTLQPGMVTGTVFEVRVSAKGITDFFGAAFWLSYNTSAVAVTGFDDTTSFLRDDGAVVKVLVDGSSTPGKVKVGISRVQNQDGTIKGVDVTSARDLIVFTFAARAAVLGNPIVFVDGQGEVDNSTAPPTNQITVAWAGGTVTVR